MTLKAYEPIPDVPAPPLEVESQLKPQQVQEALAVYLLQRGVYAQAIRLLADGAAAYTGTIGAPAPLPGHQAAALSMPLSSDVLRALQGFGNTPTTIAEDVRRGLAKGFGDAERDGSGADPSIVAEATRSPGADNAPLEFGGQAREAVRGSARLYDAPTRATRGEDAKAEPQAPQTMRFVGARENGAWDLVVAGDRFELRDTKGVVLNSIDRGSEMGRELAAALVPVNEKVRQVLTSWGLLR